MPNPGLVGNCHDQVRNGHVPATPSATAQLHVVCVKFIAPPQIGEERLTERLSPPRARSAPWRSSASTCSKT
jgi:hypothetical protein